MNVVSFVCIALLSAALAAGQTVYEQVELTVLGGRANDTVLFTMANFGAIPYGAMMQGKLMYPSPSYAGYGHSCGAMACNFACSAFDAAQPPLSFRTQSGNNIVLLDRVPDNLRVNLYNCSHLDKAVHAAAAGADAVIIIDTDDEPNVAIAKATPEYHAKQQGLRIPVGMIGATDGVTLRAALAAAGASPLQVQLNFMNVIKETAMVTVEIWHDSADDCGPSCETVRNAIASMANMATTLQLSDKRVRFEPHMMFGWNCGDSCQDKCVNQRYCYLTPTRYVTGAEVAAENVRQACMFSTLRANQRAANWWFYVTRFQQACRSVEHRFTKECSVEVFHKLWPELVDSWKSCWQDLGTTNAIEVVEQELRLAEGNTTKQARVILNPTVRINDQQYRGNFDKISIFKAICSAFPDGAEPNECSQFGSGECGPGRDGGLVCSSPNSVSRHTTKCVEKFMGYECKCADGFEEFPSLSGPLCVDINECEKYNICAPFGSRAVCVNLPGSYRCDADVRDECTEEWGYGGCWQDASRPDKKVITSCVDNFQEYQIAAASGKTLPKLSKCVCSEIPGCWHDEGYGQCVELCSGSRCLADKGVCSSVVARGWYSVWTLLFIAVIGAGVLIGTIILHRIQKHKMDQHVRRLLSDYVPLESSSSHTYTSGLESVFGQTTKLESRSSNHCVFIRSCSDSGQSLDYDDKFAGP